jgi:hypothetical protein
MITKEYTRKEQSIPRDAQVLLKDFQKQMKSAKSKTNSVKKVNKDQFYNPAELVDENIIYVDDEKKFLEMIEYLHSAKPDIIGMDCEWEPEFKTLDEIIVKTEQPRENQEKLNRPNTFQIATRHKVFIIESKDSIDQISQDTLDKFVNTILFSNDIKKLGKHILPLGIG